MPLAELPEQTPRDFKNALRVFWMLCQCLGDLKAREVLYYLQLERYSKKEGESLHSDHR